LPILESPQGTLLVEKSKGRRLETYTITGTHTSAKEKNKAAARMVSTSLKLPRIPGDFL
jgi:aspartate 1-decarboxylase